MNKPASYVIPSVSSVFEQAEQAKASTSSTAARYIFLWTKKDKIAVIRPLFNLVAGADGLEAVPMPMHQKYNPGTNKMEVDVVCASVIGLPCELCRQYQAGDKELRVRTMLMLPVYLHKIGVYQGLVDGKPSYKDDTYKTQDGTEQKVFGLRLLQLSQSGAMGDVLATLKLYWERESETHDIRDVPWTLEQTGEGKKDEKAGNPGKKLFMKPQSKAVPGPLPQPMLPLVPTQQQVVEMVLEACPPKAVAGSNGMADIGIPDEEDDMPF